MKNWFESRNRHRSGNLVNSVKIFGMSLHEACLLGTVFGGIFRPSSECEYRLGTGS